MAPIIKISEAATIAIHTIYLLARNQDRLLSNKELADIMKVSDNHLAKVLQRLVKLGLVSSIRGAKGGFKLSKPPSSITLLEIYEYFDGKIDFHSCLLDQPVCVEGTCMFGHILEDVNKNMVEYMKTKTFDIYIK
ncbi:MAG: Rrf2 family transcriptional regulator [bacterium]